MKITKKQNQLRIFVSAIKDLGYKAEKKLDEWTPKDPILRENNFIPLDVQPYEIKQLKKYIKWADDKNVRRKLLYLTYACPNNLYCPAMLKAELRRGYSLVEAVIPFEISSKSRQRKIEKYAPGSLRLLESS